MVRIQLLGGCKLVHDGSAVPGLEKSRLQSLLAYLLLNKNKPPLPRSRLAFLLWPKSSEAQALTNLRKLFYELRRVIPDADDFIATKGRTVQWRVDAAFELDVAEFERAVGAGALQRAVSLYQGDLLPECYEDWALTEKERLRRVFLCALEQLIDQLQDKGQYEAAIEYAHQLQKSERLREDTYCRLMRLYALRGDRGNVRRTYESCVEVLKQELSIEPSASTTKLYQECLRSEPSERRANKRSQVNHDSLPTGLSSFVGRTKEMTEVLRLLKSSRLLTLTGAGGCGKTRLAQQVAVESGDSYRDGIRWVDLAVLSDPELVLQAIATSLGLGERADIAIVSEQLRAQEVLLLLDNCEHLISACAQIVEALMGACPEQRILATGREALNIESETVWIVPSMSVPDIEKLAFDWGEASVEALGFYDAVQLYVERAAKVYPGFCLNKDNGLSIARICHCLDGMPLAIELAAGRSKVLSPEQIANRLDDRFNLLIGGSRTALARYQTLKAAIDWSYDLLSGLERVLFRRLAVFVGSFSLEAIEAVCSEWQTKEDLKRSEILYIFSQLVEKSLVVAEDKLTETRYRLLETIREYSIDKLREVGEEERGRTRHLEYYRDLLESVEPRSRIAWPTRVVNRLEIDYPNILSALAWGASQKSSAESVLRLIGVVPDIWNIRRELSLNEKGLRELISNESIIVPNQVRAKALTNLGSIAAIFRCDLAAANDDFNVSLELSRKLNNESGIACALFNLGYLTSLILDLENSRCYLEESLNICQAMNDPYGIALCLQELGNVLCWQGETGLGRQQIQESLEATKELDMPQWAARALLLLGNIARREGDYQRARVFYFEGSKLILEKHYRLVGCFMGFEAIGLLAAAERQYERAARLFGAVDRIAQELGTTLTPMELVEHEPAVAEAKTALGEARFSTACEFGLKMTLEQAEAYAFKIYKVPVGDERVFPVSAREID